MRNSTLLHRVIAFGAVLLMAADAFAQTSITADGKAVALTQNTAYTIENASGKYINPSWFTANNDGTYTFKAIDGNYVLIDHGSLNYIEVRTTDKDGNDLTLKTDGSGALYLVGSQVGLPSTHENPQGFNTSDLRKMISMAPVQKEVYEITLEAGKQIASGATGFYAYKSNRLTGNTTYKITSQSGDITINMSDGNLNTPAQAPYGSTIVLTVDCSKGSSDIAFKSTLNRPAKLLAPVFNDKKMSNPGYDYYYTGTLTQGADYKVTGADVINGDDWYYDVDYFSKNADGSFKFLPITGTYTVRANFATRSFQVYPSDSKGTAATYNVEDGTGAVWVRCNGGIAKPAYGYATTGMGAGINNNLAMAPIEKNKWQLTIRSGKEVDPNINLTNFYLGLYSRIDNVSPARFGYGSNVDTQWFITGFTITDKTYITIDSNKKQNIKLAQKLAADKTYRMILDTSDPKNTKLSMMALENVAIGSTGYATYCSASPLDFSSVSGLTAYIASGVSESTLTMTPVAKASAKTGLILKGTANTTYAVPQCEEDGNAKKNLLIGVTEATAIEPTANGNTNYIFAKGSNGVGFYPASSGTLAANKAYLSIPTTSAAKGMFRMNFQSTPTSIFNTLNKKDGEIDTPWYTLGGLRISKPTKGIYIHKGKKVIVR